MARAILIVLDSVGIGGAKDAERYGDSGSDTVGHIAQFCAAGKADQTGLRSGPLQVTNLAAMGLGSAALLSSGNQPPNLLEPATGAWGVAVESSVGKDTPSGHWEIAGVPTDIQWTLYPQSEPAFPKSLTDAIVQQGNVPGILGNKHASGLQIIDELGEQHINSGMPICYTSADSVLQIAAHEESFGLQRLYKLCELIRSLNDTSSLGRVIARPFSGSSAGQFVRTANRRDYTLPPPSLTLLDHLHQAGHAVIGMGKIGDIFAHRGLSEERKAAGNMALFDASLQALEDLPTGGLLFANFVDFDSEFGHARDVAGYADALEQFDQRLPELFALIQTNDLLIITADHGNDPTWKGNDHTREQVPILVHQRVQHPTPLGSRPMSDIGATLAEHLGIKSPAIGKSFLGLIQ